PWQGYNFEDAIVISERVVRDDIFTSIHIEEFELEVRETKRGEEELTSEIPNVSEEAVRNLDDNGKTSQGIKHRFGDEVLPKGVKFGRKNISEALFPDKNAYRDESNYAVPEEVNLFKDLQLDHWTADNRVNEMLQQLIKNYAKRRNTITARFKRDRFTLEVGDELPAGIVQLAKVYIAKKRKLKVGDKMAGRHGNKGVVARIVRDEDMPFLP
nr:beta subunit of RNA polymerase, chloroplastic [Tanacetum cinerariifolium]